MYVFDDYDYEHANKLIIKLAPTGMIPTKADTPHVPITPEEIIKDTKEAYKLAVRVRARLRLELVDFKLRLTLPQF